MRKITSHQITTIIDLVLVCLRYAAYNLLVVVYIYTFNQYLEIYLNEEVRQEERTEALDKEYFYHARCEVLTHPAHIVTRTDSKRST